MLKIIHKKMYLINNIISLSCLNATGRELLRRKNVYYYLWFIYILI